MRFGGTHSRAETPSHASRLTSRCLGGRAIGRVAWLVAAAAALMVTLGVSLAPAASEPEYSVGIEAPTTAVAGEQTILRIALVPQAGRRISSDGPVRISAQVVPKEGLSLSRSRFRRRHATDPKAPTLRFVADLKSQSAGSYQVAIDIRFWICGGKTCRPVREHRQIDVEITDPQNNGESNGGSDAGAVVLTTDAG